jgi:hypothetical protein
MSSAWRRIFPPILFDACHPLGVEFFRPFYMTHFSTYCIIDPLGDADCKNDVM